MPKLSNEKYKVIVEDYLSGATQKEVGERHGVTDETVGIVVRRAGYETRDYTGERNSARKWVWDFDFFKRQNPEVAYWTGFIIADGNINDEGNVMAMLISDKDTDHVVSFCNAIGVDTDSILTQENAVGVHLCRLGLGEDLKHWGIVPRKSKNFHEPHVSADLLPHFLRGWIDGDGSVYRHGRSARITVASGNYESLKWFEGALRFLGYNGQIGIYEVSDKRYSGNYSLYIGGRNQVSEVCNILMVDKCFCMGRKWNSMYKEKKKKVYRNCEWCGVEFSVDKYRAEKEPRNGRFCSRDCFNEFQRS